MAALRRMREGQEEIVLEKRAGSGGALYEGKASKGAECYVLRTSEGTVVEVTREVYLEWYQSRRAGALPEREKAEIQRIQSGSIVRERDDPRGAGRQPGRYSDPKAVCEKAAGSDGRTGRGSAYLLYLLFF